MNNKQMTRLVKLINFMNSWIIILKPLNHKRYRVLWENYDEYQARDYTLEQIALDAKCQFRDPVGLLVIKRDLDDPFSNCRETLDNYPKRKRYRIKELSSKAKGWFCRSVSDYTNDRDTINDIVNLVFTK